MQLIQPGLHLTLSDKVLACYSYLQDYPHSIRCNSGVKKYRNSIENNSNNNDILRKLFEHLVQPQFIAIFRNISLIIEKDWVAESRRDGKVPLLAYCYLLEKFIWTRWEKLENSFFKKLVCWMKPLLLQWRRYHSGKTSPWPGNDERQLYSQATNK